MSNSVPSQMFLIMIGVAVYLVYALWARSKQTAKARTDYAHMGAALVAERLGLAIVEGDPATNLMMAFHDHLAAPEEHVSPGGLFEGDETKTHTGVTLRGTPNGRPMEFRYWLETRGRRTALGREWTRTLEFRLTTEVRAPFPEFEVLLRKPNRAFAVPGVFAHPEQPTGIAAVDAALVVRTTDPRLAQLLGPLLLPLASHTYVHLVGTGRSLNLYANQTTCSIAAHYLEENARIHHEIAAALEAASAWAAAPASPRADDASAIDAVDRTYEDPNTR